MGLWVLKTAPDGATTTTGGAGSLFARVQAEVYLLAFSSAVRADRCRSQLGSEALPFYVCAANVEAVTREARDSGARGFIIDYDASRASFASAHPIPMRASSAPALR